MDNATRRKFLLASGVAAGAAIAAGATGIGLWELLSTAGRGPAPGVRGNGKLVIVTLYGGNDGLSTVIPYSDPVYHSARPELAYAAEEVLPLTDSLGLNPVLTGLKKLWDDRRLGVIVGAGYPKPDRSHFRSMDIWQTGAPAEVLTTGWVGRWLDAVKAPPEAAVSFESMLPPLLAGQSRAGACVTVSGLRLPEDITKDMVRGMGVAMDGEPPLQARAAQAFDDLLRVDALVHEAEKVAPPSVAAAGGLPATGTGGQEGLAAQLQLAAACIEAGVPTTVYSTSMGGFDTHATERSAHEGLLKQLDQALTAFVERLHATESGRDVAVMVYSEFGRRVNGNASHGTDHGTAGPVFVMGPPIKAGIYGEQPSLKDLDDGDLKMTVDYRDIVATLMAGVLDVDPGQYLPKHKVNRLPFIAGS